MGILKKTCLTTIRNTAISFLAFSVPSPAVPLTSAAFSPPLDGYVVVDGVEQLQRRLILEKCVVEAIWLRLVRKVRKGCRFDER